MLGDLEICASCLQRLRERGCAIDARDALRESAWCAERKGASEHGCPHACQPGLVLHMKKTLKWSADAQIMSLRRLPPDGVFWPTVLR